MPNVNAMAELRKPFPEDKIKKNYQGFDYVPPEHVIDRLNDVLGVEWSFEIEDIEVLTGSHYQEVVCRGRMTIYGEHRTAVGADTVSFAPNEGAPYPNPFDKAFKSAVSNCMKLCARLFGVGNQLWGGEMLPETVAMTMTEEEVAEIKKSTPPKASSPAPSERKNSGGGGGGKVSPKSWGFFEKLTGEKDWESTEHADEINNIIQTYESGDDMTQKRVSTMIDVLKPMRRPAKSGADEGNATLDDGLPF